MTHTETGADPRSVAHGATVNSEVKRLAPECTNPKCRKPRDQWGDEKRRRNSLALTCCEACRYEKKNARDRIAIRALRAGVRAMLSEIEDGGMSAEESWHTLRTIVGMNDPREFVEVVHEGRAQ